MTSLSQTYTRRASLNSKNGMMLLSLLADEGFSRRINIVNNIFVCNKSFTFEQPSSIEEKSWAKHEITNTQKNCVHDAIELMCA